MQQCYSWLLILLCVSSAAGHFNMKPTKTYERQMTLAIETEESLRECRAVAARQGETLREAKCFGDAVHTFLYNATWYKQLAALLSMTAQRKMASKYFNLSAYTVLDAQGFFTKKMPQNISQITLLKLYYTREKEGAQEVAKSLAATLTMQQKVMQAAAIIDEFLKTVTTDFKLIADLIRSLGNLPQVVEHMRHARQTRRVQRGLAPDASQSSRLILLAEEVPITAEALAIRLLSANLTITRGGRNESLVYFQAHCGVALRYSTSYTLKEIVHLLSLCVAKSGNYDELLLNESAVASTSYNRLMRTALHQMSTLGSDYLLRKAASKFPEVLSQQDNFGRTPLHYAVASQQIRGIATLLRIGGAQLLYVPDAGQISPLKMGCSNRFFRVPFEQLLQETKIADLSVKPGLSTYCSPFALDPIIHDETDEVHEDLHQGGGGWKNTGKRFEEDSCDFDIRQGHSISHHELVGHYLHSSFPVVLRDVLPVKIVNALKRSAIEREYSDMLLRRESFPASEHYGIRLERIETVEQFLKNSSRAFGVVEVFDKHRCRSLLDWLPEKLFPEEAGYCAASNNGPVLMMSGSNAATNHRFHDEHSLHVLVHGTQYFRLHPPPSALVTSTKAEFQSSDPKSLKCRLQGGDVLIIPSMWSYAFRSPEESILWSRQFGWK